MSQASPVIIALSWDDIQRDARCLANRLRPAGPFHGIVAIARGGLIPAALLAQDLDLRRIETLCITSYGHDRQRGAVTVLKGLDGDGSGWLVVDDLVDSGETAREVRRLLPQAHIAALYAKPAGRAQADTVIAEVDPAVWIVFPWET